MFVDSLEPKIDLLSEEYVLVQAWKKTASYIRYHNWYSDTLELDRAAVNLPRFLAELAVDLKAPDKWANHPLRIVPAPKSQQWQIASGTKLWEPVENGNTGCKLRPLAHVNLREQVAATAIMLCLADRVETIQGDPCGKIQDAKTRHNVISYGNRLFCDENGGELHHRWGSGKLYRSYSQDYRSFLSRSEIAAQAVDSTDGSLTVIVCVDLSKFYDRVSPALLAQKLNSLMRHGDDPHFFLLANRLLNWAWHRNDSHDVELYAKQAELSSFSAVALPQGLVASGFFANVTLLDVDQNMREALHQDIAHGVHLEDVCRYVDDLRIVVKVDPDKDIPNIEELVGQWVNSLLDRHAVGLKLAQDKTKAAVFASDQHSLVRQSKKMARIQSAISGGFDAIGGEGILDSVQGLIQSQKRYSEQRGGIDNWSFSPISDVGDATIARFAAGRFRKTYRSLRPLLENRDNPMKTDSQDVINESESIIRAVRTQADLDDEARAFALELIKDWIEDPSNVRLLRIGLDIWPAADVLNEILGLLRPFTETGGRRGAPRRVALYCLAEIFRAGATETGLVEDHECLPETIDLQAYRTTLWNEAIRLVSLPQSTLPWYLKQQVLLFLAAYEAQKAPIIRAGNSEETKHYRQLIRFLKGDKEKMTNADFATLAVLSRQSFAGKTRAIQLTGKLISAGRLEQIAERDASFALELLAESPDVSRELSPRFRDDLCIGQSRQSEGWEQLSEFVLNGGSTGSLRNEFGILEFADKFLKIWTTADSAITITPADIQLKLRRSDGRTMVLEELRITPSRFRSGGSMYQPPSWCLPDNRWRFSLGYLLRFILSANPDFTRVVRPIHWKDGIPCYRPPENHWYQRRYGFFNGQGAFGDDWLPISNWIEQFISALLGWPGCRTPNQFEWVRGDIEDARANIGVRTRELTAIQGSTRSVLMLQLTAPMVEKRSTPRPLRACVVQTVIPNIDHLLPNDLTCSQSGIRRSHRNHLSAALAAVNRLLDLRETHKGRDGRLDWLILPELSVHPRDIMTHLVPFARRHRAIILAGLTYEELFSGQPLVNSAVWVIPVWSAREGLQIRIHRQGKHHLSPGEESLNSNGAVIQGFRPCQWLVGYEWTCKKDERPLWLSASICYDATDIRLASDLRHQSDVFAIPALNKDVNTFDQMAQALHYHMFQLVIVANNGRYGGSNAYAPYYEPYERQVFHLHGQPQASISFLEIDDIQAFLSRKSDAKVQQQQQTSPNAIPPVIKWKYPPAGI